MTNQTERRLCKNCQHSEQNHIKVGIKMICASHENTVGNCKCEELVL